MLGLINDSAAFTNSIKNSNLSVVHFFAEWAEQCTQVNDVLEALSKQSEFSNVKFLSCPAETFSDIALKYKIDAVPTIILFKSASEVSRINGADAAKITNVIKQYVTDGSGDSAKTDSLNDRLAALINKSKVMLFMKGDRNTPRCGFSRQIIEILNKTGVEYETFDILTDEEVRQGLKTYSDWPTYPQLYVKGDLIGGLDIVKEMVASGQFEDALNA